MAVLDNIDLTSEEDNIQAAMMDTFEDETPGTMKLKNLQKELKKNFVEEDEDEVEEIKEFVADDLNIEDEISATYMPNDND